VEIGQIYLEEVNIKINGREMCGKALIYENEYGKRPITDSSSGESVLKYISISEGIFYITNKRKLHYLGIDGINKEIKSDLPHTTKDVFVSTYKDKVLYAYGEIFAIGPEGITMEFEEKYYNYVFVGSDNEKLYFFDEKDKTLFKVTYDSNLKEIIYHDIEKVKIIEDKIIYVVKCGYPAYNKIFIADLSNPRSCRELIQINDCQRVIDFNFRNDTLVYSCEFFSTGDIIKLYSLDVNDSSKVRELYKWKKKYYSEEDRIELNDDKIVFQKQVELQKYEEWHISYDGMKQAFIRLIDESVDAKKILREVKAEARKASRADGLSPLISLAFLPLSKENIEIIKDPVTKGKKDGYTRAAKEFEPVLAKIRQECEEIRNLHIKNKEEQNTQAEVLLDELKKLEVEKARLDKENEEKTKIIENKFGMSAGTLSVDGTLFITGIFNPLLMVRKMKYNKSEIEGYKEARTIFEGKIEIEKNKIIELKNECNDNMKQMLQFIADILSEIANVELRIAEMKLMIGE